MGFKLATVVAPLAFLFQSLARWPLMLALSVVYVASCLAARRFAPKFLSSFSTTIASFHILSLAGLSAFVSAIIVQELSPFVTATSMFTSLCDSDRVLWTSGALARIQNLNLSLKLLEMHHTFWMSLSGRKDHVTHFQLFHNVVMLWMAWAQSGPTGSSVQWLPILLNAVVHIIMYMMMYQQYRWGRTCFYPSLPLLQFIQAVLTSFAIVAVLIPSLLHDVSGLGAPRCSGSWTSFLLVMALAICYPLGYMTLHRPAADTWLAERGLGLFFMIGHNVKHLKHE